MLQRKGNQWRLYPLKVRYIQHGEEIEQWALPDKKWWTDFAEKWDHTEIIEFEELELTKEQIARFEEIRNMPEDFMNMYTEYVLKGTLPSDFPVNHPFNHIISKNENKTQKENIDVTAETVVYTTSDVADLAETVVVNMEDSLTMAETVSQLMMEIEELKTELEEIKNG